MIQDTDIRCQNGEMALNPTFQLSQSHPPKLVYRAPKDPSCAWLIYSANAPPNERAEGSTFIRSWISPDNPHVWWRSAHIPIDHQKRIGFRGNRWLKLETIKNFMSSKKLWLQKCSKSPFNPICGTPGTSWDIREAHLPGTTTARGVSSTVEFCPMECNQSWKPLGPWSSSRAKRTSSFGDCLNLIWLCKYGYYDFLFSKVGQKISPRMPIILIILLDEWEKWIVISAKGTGSYT